MALLERGCGCWRQGSTMLTSRCGDRSSLLQPARRCLGWCMAGWLHRRPRPQQPPCQEQCAPPCQLGQRMQPRPAGRSGLRTAIVAQIFVLPLAVPHFFRHAAQAFHGSRLRNARVSAALPAHSQSVRFQAARSSSERGRASPLRASAAPALLATALLLRRCLLARRAAWRAIRRTRRIACARAPAAMAAQSYAAAVGVETQVRGCAGQRGPPSRSGSAAVLVSCRLHRWAARRAPQQRGRGAREVPLLPRCGCARLCVPRTAPPPAGVQAANAWVLHRNAHSCSQLRNACTSAACTAARAGRCSWRLGPRLCHAAERAGVSLCRVPRRRRV